MTLGETLAPRWAAILFGVLGLLILSIHLLSLSRASMPSSRRRIRMGNGFLMLAAVPVLAYAVGVASPDSPREFTMSWSVVMGLMAMIIVVACLDVLNSMRLHAIERRILRRELDHARLEITKLTGAARAGGAGEPPTP